MPIYEYQCQSCGNKIEKLQRMNDDPLTDCPECEKPELKRLVSAAAFRLKGAGWYETDFKSENKRNLADTDSGGGDSEKASDSQSDSKSDSKESAKSTEGSKSGETTQSTNDSAKKKEPAKTESKSTSSGSKKADTA